MFGCLIWFLALNLKFGIKYTNCTQLESEDVKVIGKFQEINYQGRFQVQ